MLSLTIIYYYLGKHLSQNTPINIVPVLLGKQLYITWKKPTLVVKSEVLLTTEHVVL